MSRPGPRLHRLPQRLDYTLIPAPLDLSLPLIAEKSPLPAIIVTPSSPSATHDYSIAFLAPPPKPTLIQRISSLVPFSSAPALPPTPPTTPTTPSKLKAYSSKFRLNHKARTFLILSLIFFVMVCHLITHKLASRRPHLEFSSINVQEAEGARLASWFDNFADGAGLWGDALVPDDKRERDFIVIDGSLVVGNGVEGAIEGSNPLNDEVDGNSNPNSQSESTHES